MSIFNSYKKGSALLFMVLLLSIISGILAVGTAKVSQAAVNSTGSNKLTLQAQNYASSYAELMRSIKYSDLRSEAKASISNTGFKREVSVSGETSYSSTIKQKDVTIRVFNENEAFPRSSIKLTRYSVSEEAGGCQIATGTNNVSFTANGKYKSITVIASSTFVPLDGSWSGNAYFDIRINGASRGGFNCYTSTQKAGSKGHYWGTTKNVTNQKTVSANISKGNTVSVNLTSSSRLNFSTITVILGS